MSAHRRRGAPRDPAPRPGAHADGITVRQHLRRLAMDPEYLAVKDEMGEPLGPAEREVLDAWRALSRALNRPGGAP